MKEGNVTSRFLQQPSHWRIWATTIACAGLLGLGWVGLGGQLLLIGESQPTNQPQARDTIVLANNQLVAAPRLHPTGFFPGWFVSPSIGWMVLNIGRQTFLSRTSDGGQHWTAQLTLPYPHLFQRDMSFLSPTDGYVVRGIISNGQLVSQLVATGDGGAHWTERSLPTGVVSGLDFVTPRQGWVLVEQGRRTLLYYTTNGGTSWAPCEDRASGHDMGLVDPTDHLEGVRFATPTVGWVSGWKTSGHGPQPEYYVTTDGCSTWQADALPLTVADPQATQVMLIDLPGLVGGRAQGAAIVLDHNTGDYELAVYSSPNGISAWSESGLPAFSRLLPAWATLGSIRSVTLTDGHMSSESGNVTTSSGISLLSVQFVDEQNGFAVASDGSRPLLMRSSDSGATWATIGEV